ncbi:NACHT domain-containing protein [Citricoccus parietis]
MVELTYPAIAASLGDAERTELSEKWAQQRNVTVREALLQHAGPGAALSSNDLARVLQHRSEARRTVRLQSFEVDETALDLHFGRIEVPEVIPGDVVVMLGDFGSGKSETAETWHRTGIKDLMTDGNAPFPVWLSARDVLGQTLEEAVDRQLGSAWRRGRGASIVVDGLDETDPATAQNLLESARILTRTASNIRVLLTARPGILSPTDKETVRAKLFDENAALELVELTAGKAHSTWRWTKDMRATVTRPFFALAAGIMLGNNEAPSGEADLIRGLVENALAKGRERPAVTSEQTRSVLQDLAVGITRTSKDGLSYSDRLIAHSSRLVSDGPGDSVVFSLPIFQHWFAAQAIVTGDVPVAEVVTDALSFNRWRWAAAVAALSARTPEAVDDLLGKWVAGNPGAAAWIIDRAFSGHRDWRTEADENLDPTTSGTRLLRALRTWANALGPLADGVLPSQIVRGPVGLGVRVSGHRIIVALSTSRPASDRVTALPPELHPFSSSPVADWQFWLEAVAPQGDAWPWTKVQKMIAEATLKKLSTDPHLGAPDGIWEQERRFDLARRLLGHGSLLHGPLPANEVRKQAAEKFDAVDQDRSAYIKMGGRAFYSGAELDDLVSWVDATRSLDVVSHLPERDLPYPKGGWVWDFYSPQRLMEFEVEVYARACQAYDEALAHSFARLGWSMPRSSMAPFGVLLEVEFDGAERIGGIPGLRVIRAPMALMQELAPSGDESIWSASGRAVINQISRDATEEGEYFSTTLETIRSWLAAQNREPASGIGWTTTGADDMSETRPVANVAAGWLWDDLKDIGLGKGTFPQVR